MTTFPATTVDQTLQGKTAGVQITQHSGAPGSSVSVNIRGVGSFGSTTPLYIVDGFPTQNINFINPNTIESLTVLKDASATELYGVRASNGVVIIETKKGKDGKVEVELNSFIGIRSQPRKLDVLGVKDFASLATELSASDDSEIKGQGVPYEGWANPSNLRNIDWQDEIFNEAYSRSTTLSIRGGNDKAKVALSLGIFDEEGTLIRSQYKRYDAALSTKMKFTEKLTVDGNIKYITSQNIQPFGQGRGGLLNLYSNIPHLAPVGEANLRGGSNPTNLPVDANGNFGAYPDVTGETFIDGRNFVARAREADLDNVTNNILANVSANLDILNGFSTKINFGARVDNFSGWFFNPSYYRSNGNIDLRDNATFSVAQFTSNEWLAEHTLSYDKEIEAHKINVLVGYSAQRTHTKNSNTLGSGFLNNRIRAIESAAEITQRSGSFAKQTLASQFARVNYSYDSKYYLTGTVRRDGVGNRFAIENAWGIFSSFGAGWNIDEMSFMDGSKFNLLKLRGSWGQTGNFFGIAPFGFSTTFNGGTTQLDASYSFTGTPTQSQGLAPAGIPNPDLTWETQIQSNIGIDGELANGKVYFTLDYFDRTSKDFLFNINVPAQAGFPTRPVNGGTVKNNGFEFLVGYKKSIGEFSMDINTNITIAGNKITELDTPSNEVRFTNEFLNSFNGGGFWFDVTRSQQGGQVGSFYGFEADGIFQTQAEIDELNVAAGDGNFYQDEKTAPGDRKFKDLNGDGRVTGEDRTTIGSPVPDFYRSINLNFSYKNFDLGLNFYGTYGNEILNLVKRELESASGYGNQASFSNVSKEYFENRWTPSNPSNTFARALIQDGNVQNNRASSYFVEDGSYFRLRNLNFGYTIPNSITERIGVNDARFYISAQNIFTITNYTGADPEIGQNSDINGNNSVTTRGIDAGAYPVSRSVTLGLNLKF